MNKIKLRNILKALSPDATSVDFTPFDNEVKKLKDKLTEQVVVKTLEDVNVELERNRKRINFEPLLQAFNNLKQDIEARNNVLLESLDSKQGQLSNLIAENSQANEDRINELQSEIAVLAARKIEIPDFSKQIKDTEAKLLAAIETARTMDDLEDEKEKEEIQAQFAAFEKQVRELRLQLQQRGGGSMNRKITVGGVDYLTRYTDINLKAGSNVTLTAANNHTTKQVDITITASGGGYTVETPSGAIDSSNRVFIVTATPVFIVTDQGTFFENFGYTLSGTTLTVDVPPQATTGFIRSFHV